MIAKVDIRRDQSDGEWIVTVWHHDADHVLNPGKCRCRWAHNDHRFGEIDDAVSYVRGLSDRMVVTDA